MIDEAELVAGLKRRDPKAAEKMIDLYGDRLLRSAFLLCGSDEDAHDLVQDTFLEAIRSVRRFAARCAVYTWLHSILLNLSRRYHAKRSRMIYTDEMGREQVAAAVGGRHLDMDMAGALLAQAIQQLPTLLREVLILRYYEGMKLKEIAKHKGISTGTVKSRLYHARKRLRKILPDSLNLFGTQCTNG